MRYLGRCGRWGKSRRPWEAGLRYYFRNHFSGITHKTDGGVDGDRGPFLDYDL